MSQEKEELKEDLHKFLQKNFPQIAMHGGTAAIEEIDVDEGTVSIRLGGTCSGCGIAPATLQALQQHIPQNFSEIDVVYASNGYDTLTPSSPSRDGGTDDVPF